MKIIKFPVRRVDPDVLAGKRQWHSVSVPFDIPPMGGDGSKDLDMDYFGCAFKRFTDYLERRSRERVVASRGRVREDSTRQPSAEEIAEAVERTRQLADRPFRMAIVLE